MTFPSNVVAVLRNTWTGIASGFKSLKPAPTTLWMIYLLKVLESYGYFSLGLLYVLFMTEEFGVSDLRAGTSYGIYGSLLTLWGAFLSPLVDVIGVKRSLILSLGTSMVSRTALACAPTVAWARFWLYGPISMAGALGIPVMTIGIKRCTTSQNRGFAFGLFYSCMNIAAFIGGWIVEFCRQELKGGFHVASLPPESVLNSGNRILALTGGITSAVGFVVTWFLDAQQLAVDADPPAPQPLPCPSVQEEECGAGDAEFEGEGATERQMREQEGGGGGEQGSAEGLPLQPVAWTQEEKLLNGRSGSQERASAEPSLSLLVSTRAPPGDDPPAQAQRLLKEGALSSTAGVAGAARPDGRLRGRRGWRQEGGGGMVDTLRQAGQEVLWMLRYRETWKFAAVAVILTNLRTIFRHLDATLPKYELRSFGCSYPVGRVYSINPFLIIVLVPIVTAATTSTEHFDAMHWGGYISALSPLWMVLFQKPFAPVLFVIQLSLGEAVWSPRWYDYSMSVAPDGREGLFSTLSSATLFFSKLPAGVLSGALLQEFCADNGECSAAAEVPAADAPGPAPEVASDYVCQGQKMWLVIMLVTLTSPLLMLVTQRWLRPTPRAPHAPPSPTPTADSTADSPSAATSVAELTQLRSSARHRQHHPVLGPDAEQLPATLTGGSGVDALVPKQL